MDVSPPTKRVSPTESYRARGRCSDKLDDNSATRPQIATFYSSMEHSWSQESYSIADNNDDFLREPPASKHNVTSCPYVSHPAARPG